MTANNDTLPNHIHRHDFENLTGEFLEVVANINTITTLARDYANTEQLTRVNNTVIFALHFLYIDMSNRSNALLGYSDRLPYALHPTGETPTADNPPQGRQAEPEPQANPQGGKHG